MQNKFNIILSSIHPVSIQLPEMGEVQLPAQAELQLYNASVDVVNYLRSTFTNTGVSVFLNKESDNPFRIYNYDKTPEESDKTKVKKEEPKKTPLEKAADFVLPSGKHKGKKLKELDDITLKQIAKMSKNQTVISTIEGYLILKDM